MKKAIYSSRKRYSLVKQQMIQNIFLKKNIGFIMLFIFLISLLHPLNTLGQLTNSVQRATIQSGSEYSYPHFVF